MCVPTQAHSLIRISCSTMLETPNVRLNNLLILVYMLRLETEIQVRDNDRAI